MSLARLAVIGLTVRQDGLVQPQVSGTIWPTTDEGKISAERMAEHCRENEGWVGVQVVGVYVAQEIDNPNYPRVQLIDKPTDATTGAAVGAA